jgi:hypothetical protein
LSDSVENLIAKRFIARPDVKAVQGNDGAYHPERTRFTRTDLEAHLRGDRTFGHYHLSEDSKCKVICFDLDLNKTGWWHDVKTDEWHEFNPREAWMTGHGPSRSWQRFQLRCLAEGLASRMHRVLGIGTAILYSGGKGLHVYGFFKDAEPAADVRPLAHEVLESFSCFERVRGDNFWRHTQTDPKFGYPNIEIEVFPKQDSLDGKDLGNLIRLPLGVNRKSGERSFFLTGRAPLDQFIELDPLVALTEMNPWFGDS